MAGQWFGGKLETFSDGVEDFNHYGYIGEGHPLLYCDRGYRGLTDHRHNAVPTP